MEESGKSRNVEIQYNCIAEFIEQETQLCLLVYVFQRSCIWINTEFTGSNFWGLGTKF